MDTRGISSAPPRVEVVSQVWYGKIISCRAGGSARVVDKLQSCQQGEGARINTLGAPAVAKQTKPGDSLQAQVEPVVPMP